MATNPRVVGDETRAIAAELRAQRTSRQWTQEQVSAETGIPVNTLSKIERAQTAIDVEQIATIAAAYGMRPGELLDRARQSAALRARKSGPAYMRDGSLDPSTTRGFTPTASEIDELFDKE